MDEIQLDFILQNYQQLKSRRIIQRSLSQTKNKQAKCMSLRLLNFPSILFQKIIVQQMQSERHQSILKRSFRPPELEKNLPPTLATIPLRAWPEENDQSPNDANHISCYEESEKVIPGYNFQSLFRKKSHIRLARKKNRLEAAKKNSNVKLEICEKTLDRRGEQTLSLVFGDSQQTLHIQAFEKNRQNFQKYGQLHKNSIGRAVSQPSSENGEEILLKLRSEFYNSVSPDQLRYELQQNGYRLKDASIISELELKNGDIAQKNPEQDPPSFNSPPHSLQEEEQVSKQENNLLGENYEHELHLKLNY